MSDVLLVVSSESLLAIKKAGIAHPDFWGSGGKERLIDFLNRALAEMTYDEKLHIVTEVLEIRYKTRCPYLSHRHGTRVEGKGIKAVWHCAEEVVQQSRPVDVPDKCNGESE